VFGLGIGEVLLILIVVLLVFGPTKLPDLARTMGKAMAEFRKASRDLRETFEYEIHRMDEGSAQKPGSGQRPAPKLIDAEIEEARPAASPAEPASPPSGGAGAPGAPPADRNG
jgi:TatA/E family protein of Tat protein translocase